MNQQTTENSSGNIPPGIAERVLGAIGDPFGASQSLLQDAIAEVNKIARFMVINIGLIAIVLFGLFLLLGPDIEDAAMVAAAPESAPIVAQRRQQRKAKK